MTTKNQVATDMGLSVGAKFSLSIGAASISASSKMDFFQSTKTSLDTVTVLASYYQADGFKYIHGAVNLTPEALDLLKQPPPLGGYAAFREKCGNFFIIGEQSARSFFGRARLVVTDTTTASKFAAAVQLNAKYGTGSAGADTSLGKSMQQASSGSNLHIEGAPGVTTIDGLLAAYNAFPNQSGGKTQFKLKALPYDQVLNWPPNSPFVPLTDGQKLDFVATAAYGLTGLIEDANFVIQNAQLFAMGTNGGKRDARLAFMKSRRDMYQASLDSIKKNAQGCGVDWTPTCENLYTAWKSYDEFATGEYSTNPAKVFPVRYVSIVIRQSTSRRRSQVSSTRVHS